MLTKILSSTLTMVFAFMGVVVSGYAWLIADMEARDDRVVVAMRTERLAQIGELKTEIYGVKTLVQSVDSKVDILLLNKGK